MHFYERNRAKRCLPAVIDHVRFLSFVTAPRSHRLSTNQHSPVRPVMSPFTWFLAPSVMPKDELKTTPSYSFWRSLFFKGENKGRF